MRKGLPIQQGHISYRSFVILSTPNRENSQFGLFCRRFLQVFRCGRFPPQGVRLQLLHRRL